ncbi:MAG: hypothetical protein KBE41_11520, partial [Lutibacter sp.]|nr:hypothetical protein [Lutibacter sp.]
MGASFLNAQTIIPPPQIEAVGDSFFCPTTEQPIVTSFTISNPDNVEIVKLFIQISEGYNNSQDRLKLIGTHPTVTATYDISEGKLTLISSQTGASALNDLIEAAKDVVFFSSNNVSGIKKFSFTINEKNYLPSTGHYYEYIKYISDSRITWQDAKTAAESKDYYGLKGYLATITSQEEAILAGEQAGGQGWIGGSDDETEGVWKWVTGPEIGMIFWNGLVNGSSPLGIYSNWHLNEPNDWTPDGVPDIPGQENFAHIYVGGKWNDYPNYHESITGYVVEYGGMPGDPIVNFGNNETTLTVAEITTTIPSSNCGPGTVTLYATASTGTVIWFNSLTGGTKLGSGNSYTTPSISSTTTYY